MSRYRGNNEQCPTCGLAYRDFRCVFLRRYRDVFELFVTASTDPADWQYKRRHTILGYWHMCKQQDWARHKDECAEAAALGDVPF